MSGGSPVEVVKGVEVRRVHLSGLGDEWKSMNGQRSSAEVEGWREVEGRSPNGLAERSSNGVEERS